jgi:hypothetical protein
MPSHHCFAHEAIRNPKPDLVRRDNQDVLILIVALHLVRTGHRRRQRVQFRRSQRRQFYLGWTIGLTTLDWYAMAYRVIMMSDTVASGPIVAAIYPKLGEVSGDPNAVRKIFTAALSIIGLIVTPAFVGLGETADLAVPLILGTNWLQRSSDSVAHPRGLAVLYLFYITLLATGCPATSCALAPIWRPSSASRVARCSDQQLVLASALALPRCRRRRGMFAWRASTRESARRNSFRPWRCQSSGQISCS